MAVPPQMGAENCSAQLVSHVLNNHFISMEQREKNFGRQLAIPVVDSKPKLFNIKNLKFHSITTLMPSLKI